MHQLRPVKISVIKFQTSAIKLQISANVLRCLEQLTDISKYTYLYLFEDNSKRI